MAIISNSIFVDVIAILVTAIVGILTYFKWAFKYWERKNFPYMEATIPFGTLRNPFRNPEALGMLGKRTYDEFKSKGHKHGGIYVLLAPIYIPVDPEYIKNIMTRDFHHFMDRGVFHNEKDDPLSAHLFSIEGAKWKNLRAKLTPTFTSGKMKMMFQTLIECGNELKIAMDDICKRGEPVDIKDVLGCFTTDVIGSCAFGLDCNSFKEPNSDFRMNSNRVFVQEGPDMLKGFLAFSFPDLARSLRLRLLKKGVTDFFINVTKETVEYREKNNIARKDFMQLLIDLKNNVKSGDNEDHGSSQHDGKGLTMEQLAAQAFVFFIAGFETSSTTMTYCLFELSLNQGIQDKVRQEVNAVLEKYDGKLSYDAIMEMRYMRQVIDETLRKYPPVPVLNRKCKEDYQIPETDLTIEKGTAVMIPVLGLHHDAEHFPNPENFDPDRFSEENKSKINPFAYLPFGEGPRSCIGIRFGVMQTKVGLAILLKNYKFSLNPKTQTPLQITPFSFTLSPLGGVWLNVTKVEQ